MFHLSGFRVQNREHAALHASSRQFHVTGERAARTIFAAAIVTVCDLDKPGLRIRRARVPGAQRRKQQQCGQYADQQD